MKIDNVNLSESLFNDGLGNIKMERLGDIVVLAGANGAGKSRLLRRIETTVQNYKNAAFVNRTNRTIISHQNSSFASRPSDNLDIYIDSVKREKNKLIYQTALKFDSDYEEYHAIKFVPTELEYYPPTDMNHKRINDIYEQLKTSRSLSGKNHLWICC